MYFSDFKSTSITLVKSDFDFDRLKLLYLEFATSIDFDLNYKSFLQELASVNELYAAPNGIAFILSHHNNTVGCVGVRNTTNGSAVIKRLYIRDIFRHAEYARQLLSVAVDWATQTGKGKVRFESADIMQSAIKVFENSGFSQILNQKRENEFLSQFYEMNLHSVGEYHRMAAS